MTPLVEIQGLTKAYKNKAALNNLDLTIEAGRIVGLLGPNGAGKTTLIKAMNGLLETEGSLCINGKAPGKETKALVSYLPERSYFDEDKKVSYFIRFFKDFYEDFDEERAHKLLKDVSIDENTKIKRLSKGAKDKLQLILALSRRARLYLLDEPIGGVDPAAREYILNLVLDIYDPESTILISTHLITDVERIFDDVIFLKEGEILLSGNADTIRAEHGKSIDELFREVFQCSVNS